MQVSVRGSRNKTDARYFRQAVLYYGQQLFSRQMLPNIMVQVQVMKKLAYNGMCGPIDPYRPREFEIELRSMPRMNMLVTLAHEMVHCKQFAYKELKTVYYKRQSRTFWQGQDFNDVDYWDHPWEIEAYGNETRLAAKFLRHTGLYQYFGQRTKDWNV